MCKDNFLFVGYTYDIAYTYTVDNFVIILLTILEILKTAREKY